MRSVLSSVVIAVSVCSPVRAETVALNFGGISIPAFVQSMYRTMLARDFVIAPELLTSDRTISVSVKAIDTREVPRFVDAVLAREGVRGEVKDGVWYLGFSSGGVVGASGAVHAADGLGSVVRGSGVGQRGPVGDVAPALLAGGAVGVLPSELVRDDLQRDVLRPRNRKADFVVAACNAVFGASKPCVAVGASVVVSAAPETLDKVRQLVDQIDTAAAKVKLSATFVEVSRSDSSSFGVSLIADVLGARLGVRVGDTSNGAVTLKTGRFEAVVDALAGDGRFRQIASPTAVVDDNEKGVLSFGDSVPTLSSTALDRNGTPIQQVSYQQAGVLLNVSPSVLGSGRINVVVDGQVSSFSRTSTGVNGSPTLTKRQVQTAVTVDDGELLIIGGLNDNRQSESSSGLSFLPKSWAGRSSSNATTDLVLILSANVVK